MTIHDDFDELASAYLDGEATADEVARVESDPALLARVDEFRLLANAVAAPVISPNEQARDAAIAAAIAATPGLTLGSRTPAPNVSSLDAARAKRAQRNSRLLSVAAALVAVAVGGAIIWSIARGDDRGQETATMATADDAADAVSDTAESAGASASAMVDDEDSEAMEDSAMEDSAMEDAAMNEAAMDEEAMEEAAQEESLVEAETEELRLGDDDDVTATESADAVDDDAVEADAGSASEGFSLDQATTLPQFYAALVDPAARDLGETDGATDEAGLFAPPIEERVDYRGTFATIEDLLAEASSFAEPAIEPASLAAADCAPLISRLILADSIVAAGTAHLIDPVTGSPVALALLQVAANDLDALVAIGLDDCRLFAGEDVIP